MFADGARPHSPIAAYAGTLRFGDAQEQASALTGWNQDYLQLSAGAFQGELRQAQAPGVRLFVEQLQQSVWQTGVLPGNVLAMGIALQADGDGTFCGSACGTGSLHVFSGSSGFEFRSSRRHSMLAIELQGGEAGLHPDGADTFAWQVPGMPTRPGAWRIAPAAFSELRAYLLALFGSALTSPAVLANTAVAATVADFLLDRIAQAAGHGSGGLAGDSCTHWKLVQRACALARVDTDQSPTVAQLCADLGVSRRTLQNGFQQVLGTSPLVYLKAVRLRRARLALQHAASVTEAATACGFWHFGHFAQDYQAMFGERPSDTLRRQSPGRRPGPTAF